MPESADALVEGTVITMDSDRRIIRDGAVAVRDGQIAAVGLADELRQRFTTQRRLGGTHRFVIPGLSEHLPRLHPR
jgi:5-methylthioadenosine/S-adenosylhomocysteine deaminase